MRRLLIVAALSLVAAAPAPTPAPGSSVVAPQPSQPSARWPLTLRDGLPPSLPGWTPAPTDALPDDGENAMGRYAEVSRFFQKIESPTSTKQFQISVQDYGTGPDLLPELRQAVAEAAKTGVETRETDISGHRAFVATDKSSGKPTTIVTVIVSGRRLVLGAGANVSGTEALALVKAVDFVRVAAAH
jgi:hypothetical protein